MKNIVLFLTLTLMLIAISVNAQAPIFSEDFESTNLPTGWTLIDANNDGQNWVHSYNMPLIGHNNSECVGSFSQNTTPDNWLVTPAISLGSSSTLTFWRSSGFQTPAEHYGVYVSTTSATDISSFTLLHEETLYANTWEEKTVNLGDYDNSTVYIAFRHFNCTNKYVLILDDIVVTSTISSGFIDVNPDILHFTNVLVNAPSAGQLVTVDAYNISDVVTASAPHPFEVSTDNNNYSYSVTLSDTDHVLYVRYVPDAVGTDSNILILSSGTTSTNILLYGNSIACESPTNLSVVSVTSNSAIVNWTGNANGYNIYYKAASDIDWSVIEYVSDNPAGYVIDSLSPSTTYTWYIASVCDDGSTINSDNTGTFTTSCAPFTVPFSQDFQAATILPQCWNRYRAWANDAFAGGSLTSVSSGWNFWDSHAFGDNHARLNIYGTECNQWLVTPPIDLTGLSYPTLTFDLALTAYGSSSSIANIGNQPDDKFMVIISADGGATWNASNATIWSNDGNGDYVYDQIPAAGQEISISLTDYINQTIRIAFYGESTITNGDNNIHIDNVTVVNNTSCANPSNLTVAAVTNTSVTLTWFEKGSATIWNIEYGPSGYQQGSSNATLVQTNTDPYTINNLSTGAYDFYIQADCGDEQSLWQGPVTATPGGFNMGTSGIDTLTTCSAIVYDNGGASGDYSAYCNYTLVILPEINGNHISVSGNYNTENCCDYLRIYDGASTSGTMLGEFKGEGSISNLVSSTGPMTLVFHSDNSVQYEGLELYVSCVACLPPLNLNASNVTYSSATLTWTGTSSSYIVEYKAEQDTVWTTETVFDTAFVLTGLHESTAYTVNVYGNCNGEPSIAATISFSTTMIPLDIPFSTNFSTLTDWIFNNGSCSNYWTFGAVSDTENALFVTNNGNTPGYSTLGGTFSVVSVEKLFTVGDVAELEISFDVQVGGEDMFDYLKVFLAPADEEYPAATTNVTYANMGFSTYAVDFSNYLQYSEYGSSPYKYNLTEGNTVHVNVVISNPNPSPDANSTAKIVFLWKNDNSEGFQPGAIIRNFAIEAMVCHAPTDLTVSNITTTSADVSWMATGNESDWLLEYKEDEASSWTSIPVSGSTSYSLTDLTIGTVYQLRVQAVCNAIDQSIWVSTSFSTFCETINTFPYTEDFEHGGHMPDCWTQEQVQGYLEWEFQTGGNSASYIQEAHSGLYNAYLFEEGNEALIARLVTPTLDLNGMTEAYVTYWYAQEAWGNDQDQLSVYYRSNPNDPWQQLIHYNTSVNTWTKDTLELPDLSATYQLAFVGMVSNGYGILLDDITIDGITTPIVVTNPSVTTTLATNVSQTTAILNATINNPDEVSITSKGFEWKLTNGGSYTQIAGSGSDTTFSALLTGLSENTAYTFKAFISYNDTTIYGNEMSFTTLPVGIDNLTLTCNISLMPNPADSYIELSVSSNLELKEAAVFNAFGQMIQTVVLTDNHARIDLSNIASGLYFVRINGNNVTATKKFIRK